MKDFLNTDIGRLRLLGFAEGTTLLILVFVAVPLKYVADIPVVVKVLGPVHGAFFLLFVLNTFKVSVQQRWAFSNITWKVLLGCLLPFGTFYVDRNVLQKLHS